MGKNIYFKHAGRQVPISGGVVGATVNYSFAQKTTQAIKKLISVPTLILGKVNVVELLSPRQLAGVDLEVTVQH